MVEKIQMALVLLGALAVINVAYLGVWVVLARALRLGVASYVLGAGPVVFQSGALKVRLLPIRSFVDPAMRNALLPPPPQVAEALERGETQYFDDLPFAVSLALALLSALICFLSAAIFLGVGTAAQATAGGVRDYLLGVMGPFSTAPLLLDEALRIYRGSSASSVFGHALALCGTMNLLWLPSSVMALLAMPNKSSSWPKVRTLMWLLGRATEVVWLAAFLLWLLR